MQSPHEYKQEVNDRLPYDDDKLYTVANIDGYMLNRLEALKARLYTEQRIVNMRDWAQFIEPVLVGLEFYSEVVDGS